MLYRALRAAIVVSVVAAIDYALLRAEIRYRPAIAGALANAFLVAQVGLCAVWLAIGRDPLVVQVPAAACIGFSVWHYLANWNERALSEFAPGYWTQVVIVGVVLVGMRALGFRLQRARPLGASLAALPALPRFAIRDIMIATLVVAVSLALLTRLDAMNVRRDAAMISLVAGVFLGALTLLSVVSMLVARRVLLWSIVTSAAGFLLGFWIGIAIEYNLVVSTLAIGMPIVFQLAALAIVRARGNRFRRAPTGANVASESLAA
jgi:hypothetical protein